MLSNDDAVRPRVFVGCSSEQLPVAKELQILLDRSCEVEIWTQGLFSPGASTLSSLVKGAARFDAAVLVVSADDGTIVRGGYASTTRDNVIFELGLFMGAVGPERTFMLEDRTAPLELPSDLAGVTTVDYQPHSSGNLTAALGAAATRLEKAIRAAGPLAGAMRSNTAAQQEVAAGVALSDEGEVEPEATAAFVKELVRSWIDARPNESKSILAVVKGLEELGFRLTPSVPRKGGKRSRSYLRALRADGKSAGTLESTGFYFVGTAPLVKPEEAWVGRYPYVLWTDEGAVDVVLRVSARYRAQ